eukprot:s2466_g6.t1
MYFIALSEYPAASIPMTFAIGHEATSQSVEAYDRYVHNHAFPPSNKRKVTEIVCDGHAKVHVKCGSLDKKHPGKPRANGKRKPYGYGWFMAVDPRTLRVLGVSCLHQPEGNEVMDGILTRLLPKTDSRAWPSGSQPPLQAGQVPPATPPYTPTTHAPTSCWEETYQPTEAKPTAATYHTAYTAPPPVHAHYDAWHDDDGPATAPVMPRAAQAAAPQAARAAPSYHQAYSTHPPPASFPPAKSTSSKFPPVQVQNIPGGRRRADWPKGFSPNEQSHVFPEASGGTVRYRNVWTEFAYKHEEEALRDSSEFYRDLQYLQLEPHEYTEGYTAYWRRHGLRAFELKRLFHLYRIEQLKLSVR